MEADTASQPALRLWLKLLSCETHIEQTLRSPLRRHLWMTLPQFDVLAKLDHRQKPLTMTQLSQQLMVSNGNITGVVDRLVRAGHGDGHGDGHGERTPSAEDMQSPTDLSASLRPSII